MIYLELFIAVLLVNIAPAFVPPTWTVLVYFIIRHQLYLPAVILCGVFAATIGRYILSRYINLVAHVLFNEKQIQNISYLGKRLGKTQKLNFLFTFLYSLTPLSTTVLFVAAGIAQVKMKIILFGFFLGRLISYAILGVSAKALSKQVSQMAMEGLTWENILISGMAVVVFFFFIFIDWAMLLEQKKIKINVHIWKWSK